MPKQKPKSFSLNPEQLAAVNAGPGAFAVISGPGSGKTAVLVARYKRLRETIPIHEVLSLTFTKTAAKEMRDRANEKEIAENQRPCGFVTFHSFCLSVVTREHDQFGYELQHFPLATVGQSGKIMGEVSRRYNLDFRILQNWISLQKRKHIRGVEAVRNADEVGIEQALALAYKEYETKLREAGLMDFDSLLLEVVDLLVSRKDIRDRYQYEYIQCDEAQDTDASQLKLLQLLSEKHGNVFLVGDQNQNVFEWRGASSSTLLNFTDYFPNGKTLYLQTNYRATKKLTDFNYQIAPNQPPTPYISPHDEGESPVITSYSNELAEAREVCKQIRSRNPTPRLFDVGGPPNIWPDINAAILARTNRSLRQFEEALSDASIRYYLLGRSGFWNQPEIRNVLAHVQCAVIPHDAALQAAIRAPFYPSRFIKKKELLSALAQTQKRSEVGGAKWPLWEILGSYQDSNQQQNNAIAGFRNFVLGLIRYRLRMKAGEAVRSIVRDLKALEYYTDEEESVDNDPVSNLQELVRIADRFASVPEFLDYVRKIQNASRSKKGVAVGTIHASKGREFDTVFIVNCQEGILPHIRGEFEEEKRIFFVGCSRAAKRLFISYSGAASRFLEKFLSEDTQHVV